MTDAELLQHWMSRQDGGLTQAQAAERLGLTQSGVNQVLKGKCNLSEVGRKFIAHLISDLDAPTPEPQAITCDAYARCKICGEMGWINSHVCPASWQVFEIDGDNIGYEREIRAASAEDAALRYAEHTDTESAEYNFVKYGGKVIVRKRTGLERVEMFEIAGELIPQYTAAPLMPSEKILASLKTYTTEEEE